jgi:hypothetical protein
MAGGNDPEELQANFDRVKRIIQAGAMWYWATEEVC